MDGGALSSGSAIWRKPGRRLRRVNDGKEIAAIQPAILIHKDGTLTGAGRTRDGDLHRSGRLTAQDLGKGKRRVYLIPTQYRRKGDPERWQNCCLHTQLHFTKSNIAISMTIQWKTK